MNSFTQDGFPTENDADERFEALMLEIGLFRPIKQVIGFYRYYKIDSEFKMPRIDWILLPMEKAWRRGWGNGAIGIESKKSNTKLGRPISQIMDYSNAVWLGPKNVLIQCKYYFLWPCEKLSGDIASIMAQNRFGTVCENGSRGDDWHRITFYCGEQAVIRHNITQDKTDIGGNFGNKTGSR